MLQVEFSGIRSKLYKECLIEFPDARQQDIVVMKKYLNPKKDETILEVGAGSGFFSGLLADMLTNGKLIVSDPSGEQLEAVSSLNKKNVSVVAEGADKLTLENSQVDAVWSFGAMHHCFDKKMAFSNFSRILKKGGRLVIADVWSGSKLAKHFDSQVSKYCVTGHEVAFWSDEFAESLCYLSGFKKPKITNLHLQWKFKTKKEIGIFLYKIHAMTKTTPEECLRGAEKILGIKKDRGYYLLNWPMKVLVAYK